ncbi:hypothetical protein C7N43_28775 [Sphingobacteriales bacterium UPWRP_1]|nr:hypothetical protein B6N25_04390 [Sphingobacteriales bacterium TSM_CSS]PSJ73496.1 hypothetical protein C7N43_28775 [Sphingobacteriales bacterium UPWRP_1]
MKLLPVESAKHEREFINMPAVLYKTDANYIQPLDADIESVFDPKQNKRLLQGQVMRWLLYNSQNKLIGRIAAYTGHKEFGKNGEPVGGVGFFECINDQTAANMLFDAAKNWLQGFGMEGMDGPVNFGERDRWWGLLIDGFLPPAYCMNYNPPYYRQLFENYGFKVYFKQYTFYRRIDDPVPEKYRLRAEKVLNDPLYAFGHIHKKDLAGYAMQFRKVYNEAWAPIHKDFKPMTEVQAQQLINSMKPIIDEKIMYFGYYKKEPIAFFICLPDINPIVKLLHGKFNLFAKLRFWWHLKTGYCNRMFGVVFGVSPEHQQKGVESALIMTASRVLQSEGYKRYHDMELTWIGDFNPKMVNIARGIGGKLYKTHATYRKWFDETKPVERHEIIGL